MQTKFLITLLIFVGASFVGLSAQNKIQLDSKQASVMLKNDTKIIVLDVRTAEEFNEGHIKGAVNIDIRQPDAYGKIDKLNHDAKYIVHCRTNHRSGIATDYMMQKGFKNVYQMMDGFPGWAANKLPWVK
jgi:phage shock protein E